MVAVRISIQVGCKPEERTLPWKTRNPVVLRLLWLYHKDCRRPLYPIGFCHNCGRTLPDEVLLGYNPVVDFTDSRP